MAVGDAPSSCLESLAFLILGVRTQADSLVVCGQGRAATRVGRWFLLVEFASLRVPHHASSGVKQW